MASRRFQIETIGKPRKRRSNHQEAKKIFGVERDADLARALKMERGEISNWKTRDTRPYAKCIQIAQEKCVCLEWLLTGEGPMVRHEVREAPPMAFQPPSGLAVAPARVASLLAAVAQLPVAEQERVIGELCARAEDAQQIAELKAAVAAIKAGKTERAA